MRTLSQRLRRNRGFIVIALADSIVWVGSLTAATLARLDFRWGQIDIGGLALVCTLAVAVNLAGGIASGLYLGRRRLGSFEEVRWIGATALAVTAVIFPTVLLSTTPSRLIPLSAVLAGPAYAVLGATGVRYLVRAYLETRSRSMHERPHPMLVFGAGRAGEEAVRALWQDSETDLRPVAFLDDDPAKARLRLRGLPIVGDRAKIAAAAEAYGADTLLIAMPTVPAAEIADVADRAQAAGLAVRILPRLAKFMVAGHDTVQVSDIRELTFADFLGRDEVRLDLDQIARYVTGRRVLVTGAGGSIGSQLCNTLARFDPAELLMLDRDENALHALQLSLDGTARLDNPQLILADIRDEIAIGKIMEEHAPHVVFHAAAHKHVTFLERYPEEGIKTNVFGTLNVLDAAFRSGVDRFVNVSTDKAADPVNVLGTTKRIGEMLTAHYAETRPGVFMSVRFGNVLGSNGSVIPTFQEQLRRGEALTVTHPEVTRYFMTVEEAVQLVVQAGAYGGAGEVFVLDMGEPVRIVELARRLAAIVKPGHDPQLVYTGLRPGEKLHETLVSSDDVMLDRPHELLSRFRPPSLHPDRLSSLHGAPDRDKLTRVLAELVASDDDGGVERSGGGGRRIAR